MRSVPNLVWLKSFDCAARHMNFTAAAGELGITQTALSLHVRSLEAQLGCKLFTRAARRLTLTEIGQAYAFSVRRALGDISGATTSLFGADTAQMLTVRVPISSATLWLAGHLPDFTARHPGISIRLVSNIWAESAGRENVDVELRVGIGDWDDAPSKRLSSERVVPIGPASTTAAGPPGMVPLDRLKQAPRIQVLGLESLWRQYLSAHEDHTPLPPPVFAVDTTIAAVDIVAAGGGHAVILERFAQTALSGGRQIAIIGAPVKITQGHYLMITPGAEDKVAAKLLFEAWLEGIFQASPPHTA